MPPLVNDDDFAKVENKEELKFAKVRFAGIWESNSPLVDPDYERFTRYVMSGGRKYLAYKLMHDTFYEMKLIRYPKWRKRKEKAQAGAMAKEDSEQEGADESSVGDQNAEQSDEFMLDPMKIFKKALKNCEPLVTTQKIKRGGATYQVPYPLMDKQKEYYATKWLIKAVKERSKPRVKRFPEIMARELIEAAHGQGKVIKMRDDIHRLADANKAYAHYRWG